MELTQELLKEYLHYEPLTGVFTWVKKPNRNILLGSIAGCLDSNGYLKITILGNQTYGHRLAFLYMTGSIPPEIDHKDLNPSNCVWGNLRPCTKAENARNRRLNSRNTSGIKGVRWCKQANKWKVTIVTDYKQQHLGYFSKLEEAKSCIATVRASQHKEFANHG